MHQHISVMQANAHNVLVEGTVNVKDSIPGPEIVRPVTIVYPELRSRLLTMELLVTSAPAVRLLFVYLTSKGSSVSALNFGNRRKK